MKRVSLMQSLLLNEMKKASDEGRELPIRWSIKHMYSSTQFAILLAKKRKLDEVTCAMAATLHDLYVIKTGKKENHAALAKTYVIDFINMFNNGPWNKKVAQVDDELLHCIIEMISKHSEKEIFTDKPYVELLKDADVIDRYLYGVKDKRTGTLERIDRILEELHITGDRV